MTLTLIIAMFVGGLILGGIIVLVRDATWAARGIARAARRKNNTVNGMYYRLATDEELSIPVTTALQVEERQSGALVSRDGKHIGTMYRAIGDAPGFLVYPRLGDGGLCVLFPTAAKAAAYLARRYDDTTVGAYGL